MMTDGMLQDLSDYIKSGILKLQDTWQVSGVTVSVLVPWSGV